MPPMRRVGQIVFNRHAIRLAKWLLMSRLQFSIYHLKLESSMCLLSGVCITWAGSRVRFTFGALFATCALEGVEDVIGIATSTAAISWQIMHIHWRWHSIDSVHQTLQQDHLSAKCRAEKLVVGQKEDRPTNCFPVLRGHTCPSQVSTDISTCITKHNVQIDVRHTICVVENYRKLATEKAFHGMICFCFFLFPANVTCQFKVFLKR